jgi:hypothetical protein
MLKDILGDAIVEDALALDHLMLFGIEGGRVVLEVLDQRSRLRSFIKDLRLAFVDAATAAHGRVPWLCEIHLCRGSNSSVEIRGGGNGRHDSTLRPLPRRKR